MLEQRYIDITITISIIYLDISDESNVVIVSHFQNQTMHKCSANTDAH